MDVKRTQNPPNGGIKSEDGIAMVETLPLLVVFTILVAYGLGMWGSIHTGILHSIAARTYAFETFRNRTNLTYFRENRSGLTRPQHYLKREFRFHAIQSIHAPGEEFYATQRPMALVLDSGRDPASREDHNVNIHSLSGRNPRQGGIGANPIWIMVGYGMCLNPQCGGEP